MMNPKSVCRLLIWPFFVLLMVRCKEQNDVLTPNSFTRSFIPVSEGLDGSAVIVLEDEEYTGAVIGICYQEDTNSLFVVYDGGGTLVRWNLISKIADKTYYSLSIQKASTLQFSQNCGKVLGSTKVEKRINRDNVLIEYVFDIRLWNTENGEVVDCLEGCEIMDKEPLGIGATINANGDDYLIYSERSYFYHRESDLNESLIIRGPEEHSPTISQTILSPTSGQFVIAYLEGGVSIGNDPVYGRRWIQKDTPEDKKTVQTLVMDSTERYIARLYDQRLTVWQKGLIFSQQLMNVAVSDEKLLAFDQTGQLLFVGGSGHIQVWNIRQKKLAKEIPAKGITALAISQDNRLLIWGGENGQVHIWGTITDQGN